MKFLFFFQRNSKYEKIVMLTYAQDGREFVQDIAVRFRTPRDGKLPIGVLTLSEQKSIAINNPEKFVLDMFPQVKKKKKWRNSHTNLILYTTYSLLHNLLTMRFLQIGIFSEIRY